MKTMEGASFLAPSNKSLTLLAPTPTNISIKDEPETEKNGTFASPATAFAKSVLPVPGGPTKSTPFGILAPSLRYLSGCIKKSTISFTSSFASSTPATSENLVFGFSEFTSFLLLPIPKIPPPIFFCIRFAKNIQIPKKINIGSIQEKRSSLNQLVSLKAVYAILFFSRRGIKVGSSPTFFAIYITFSPLFLATAFIIVCPMATCCTSLAFIKSFI